jgi:hypothetical protein
MNYTTEEWRAKVKEARKQQRKAENFRSYLMTFDNVDKLVYIYFMEKYKLDLYNAGDDTLIDILGLGYHCDKIQDRIEELSFIEPK